MPIKRQFSKNIQTAPRVIQRPEDSFDNLDAISSNLLQTPPNETVFVISTWKQESRRKIPQNQQSSKKTIFSLESRFSSRNCLGRTKIMKNSAPLPQIPLFGLQP
eukprot:TRINITY_DN4205_c2_g1_i2.p1 TRINITY_DN4205_c2_g1~~TRINITY_DN4205_c2_g1_i2.p1  ORF type:complete len:105 (+),score=3.02 TRINITY_DN4205_c2_g1_i2:65-379(+)